jgi:hypothetical protein
MDFVESVSSPGAGFVPAADRIAGFDTDGTLWVLLQVPQDPCLRPLGR